MQTSHTRQNQKIFEVEIVSYLSAAGELPRLEAAVPGLCFYFSELSAWNKRLNLTGLKSPGKMVAKHLGDTLVLARWLPERVKSVIDIGTGAGIPGLILKILCPDLEVCLLDARRKRISFLMSVIAGLGLSDVKAVHGRAGEICPEFLSVNPQGFDAAVSQAVGSLPDLARMSADYVSVHGVMVAMKGQEGENELRECEDMLSRLGFEAEAIKVFTPVERYGRYLIIMRKTV